MVRGAVRNLEAEAHVQEERPVKREPSRAGPVRALLWSALAGVTLFVALLDLLPPTARDALIHHLAIPKIWLLSGGFVETPWAYFSYYPMNLELVYWAVLALGADWAAQFIHHGFGLLTAGLVYLHVAKRRGRGWALFGALLFLGTPMVMRLGASAYVDLGLAFFMTAAALSLIQWGETAQSRWWVLSAAAAGLALGTKYQTLIGFPPLAAAVLCLGLRRGEAAGRACGRTVLYFALAGLVFSPWAVKNVVLTGNPIYPLFNSLFGLPALMSGDMYTDVFTQRHFLYGESLPWMLMIPVRFFFQGRDFTPQFFDGVLNPLLLLLPLCALWPPRLKNRPVETVPLALSALYWILVVGFKAPLARYLTPVLPILAILSVYGLAGLWDRPAGGGLRGAARAILVITVAGLLLVNGAWALDFWRHKDPWPFLTGRVDRQGYLTEKLDHYPAMTYINTHLPRDVRILFIYAGSRGYYCDRPYFYQTWFSGEILRPVLEKAKSGQDVRDALAARATHLLTRDRLLRQYLHGQYPPEKVRLVADFYKRFLVERFRARGYTVYEIR